MGGGSSKSNNNYTWYSTAEETVGDVSMKGKNVIVTGANTGIGYETARVLAKNGAKVVIACRDLVKGEHAVKGIISSNPNADIALLPLDLTSLDSIRIFAAAFKKMNLPLHVLINNAGVMATPLERTKEGFELQFGTNHLGHFLLTNLLLDELKRGAPARVVNVSSFAHKMSDVHWDDPNFNSSTYWRLPAYGQSKTANILFSVELNRRFNKYGIYSNALHPGAVYTELARSFMFHSYGMGSLYTMGFVKSAHQGAATSVYVATAPELERVGGHYFSDSKNADAMVSSYAVDPEAAKRLWTLSEKLVGLPPAAN